MVTIKPPSLFLLGFHVAFLFLFLFLFVPLTAEQEMPYVMIKSEGNLTGNDRYEGFCIDLLKAIAGMVGFNYVITLAPDKKYGILDPDTGEWNGIVRQIMDKVYIYIYIHLLYKIFYVYFLFVYVLYM